MAERKAQPMIETLADLKPDPRNARRHNPRNVGMLEKALGEVGAARSIVIDEHGVVLAGNATIEAAGRAGIERVQVVDADGETIIAVRRTGLTAKQKTRLALYDNRTAELADWDSEVIADMLATEREVLDGLFENYELEEIVEEAIQPVQSDAEPQFDRAAELLQKWKVEAGDLWIIGEHRLLCGDSTKAEDVGRLMAGAKADLCFTSPPYGAGNVAKLRDHYVRGAAKRESFYDQHEDDPESWPSLMAGWYDAFRPVSECVVCNVQMLADNKRALVAWLAERAADLCDVIVWDKINAAPQMQANVLSNAFEFCFVFGGNASRAIPFADFHGTLSNVLRLDPRGKNDQADKHRAVFPVELPAWFIHTLCKKARSVVDPFCGTGTTLIAAEQLGRKCYGMEISPAYCAVILERMQAAFPDIKIQRAS